jgi:OST-HTH/LOTUS domain
VEGAKQSPRRRPRAASARHDRHGPLISDSLVSACNEFIDYAHLPGVTPPPATKRVVTKAPDKKAATKKTPAKTSASAVPAAKAATDLLVRAIRVGLQKSDDDWVYAAGVKSQMQRMDPAFKEKSLGFSTFREFVESRSDQVVSKLANGQLAVRLA